MKSNGALLTVVLVLPNFPITFCSYLNRVQSACLTGGKISNIMFDFAVSFSRFFNDFP